MTAALKETAWWCVSGAAFVAAGLSASPTRLSTVVAGVLLLIVGFRRGSRRP